MIASIKILHTVIWVVMAWAVFYILYAGISGNINGTLYIAAGLISLEIVVLLIFRWACPLTIVAKNIKPDWKDGDDIYLPLWLAVNNKMIFGILLTIGVALVGLRLFSGWPLM